MKIVMHAPVSALGDADRPPTYHSTSVLAFPRTVEYAQAIEPPPPRRSLHDFAFGLFYAVVIAFFAWAVFKGYVFGGTPP